MMNQFLKGNVMMMIRHMRLSFAFLAAAMGLAQTLHAQEYPSKLITLVVPYATGGSTNTWALMLSTKLREKWGQPVIVENRAGANGNVGAAAVYKAEPDGYTLLVTAPGPLVINKSLYAKLDYEPEAFAPVSLVLMAPNVLVVNPKVGVNSVNQFISLAKSDPKRLNYASQGSGATSHLAAESFKMMAGVNVTHIPYKGSGPALVDLIGGQVDMMFAEISTALPHINSGKLRLLAVGSEKRDPALPDVPTVSETLPGFFSATWTGIVAPPKTPQFITEKLSAAIAEAMRHPDVVKSAREASAIVIASNPADMAKFTKQEAERWGRVIRATDTKLD